MLTKEQVRQHHALSCGSRIYKECRFDECDCSCHVPELWDFELDMLEWGDALWDEEARW